MHSLSRDTWFYLSGIGFLGSLVLFGYLLSQYRAAVKALDQGEAAPSRPKVFEPPMPVLEPVPALKPAPQPIFLETESDPIALEKPFILEPAQPAPIPVAPAAAVETPAPSVVPEEIKSQLNQMDKDVAELKDSAAKQASLGEDIVRRLGELSKQLQESKASAARQQAGPGEDILKRLAELSQQLKDGLAAKTTASAANKTASTTGGLSPAVVYLQNLKTQMDALDKDVADLKSSLKSQAGQGADILKRLTELSRGLKSSAPASAQPEPDLEPVIHDITVPASVELELAAAPEIQAAPAAAPEGAVEAKPTQRGPVWPV